MSGGVFPIPLTLSCHVEGTLAFVFTMQVDAAISPSRYPPASKILGNTERGGARYSATQVRA